MGTRRIQKRFKNFVDHPDGSRSIPLNAEMQEILNHQLEAFKEKFGRAAGPDDPIFFDPEVDTPQEFSESQIAMFDDLLIQSMIRADIPGELIFAYLKTHRMVTEENMQFLSDEELQEWNEAIDEYGADARIQSALAKTIESCEKARTIERVEPLHVRNLLAKTWISERAYRRASSSAVLLLRTDESIRVWHFRKSGGSPLPWEA